jgi:hypothetical protein
MTAPQALVECCVRGARRRINEQQPNPTITHRRRHDQGNTEAQVEATLEAYYWLCAAG